MNEHAMTTDAHAEHQGCDDDEPHAGGHHHRRGLMVLLPAAHHHHHEDSGYPRIVFVGNPNVGKSTLFNALLGANATVMNAPGTTVLIEAGHLHHDGRMWDVVDTPGTASLDLSLIHI